MAWAGDLRQRNALHIHAQVNGALGQGKREELITHMRLSGRSPHAENGRLSAGDHDRLSSAKP